MGTRELSVGKNNRRGKQHMHCTNRMWSQYNNLGQPEKEGTRETVEVFRPDKSGYLRCPGSTN